MPKTLTLLSLLFLASNAYAQYGECDPLNVNWMATSDASWDSTLDSICANGPARPTPINNCGQIGYAFITYSDATILSDGTIQAFAASEDLSIHASIADVQLTSTVKLPNSQTLPMGGYSTHGYAMGHAGFAFDPNNIGDMTISSKHEINWPGCDGYGIILLTSATIRIGATVEWYEFDYGLEPNPTPAGSVYIPMEGNCASTTVCGNNGIFTDASNGGSGYIKEYIPWISFGGNPIPHGTGAGFCSLIKPIIRTNASAGAPYCFDIGIK